MKYGVVSCDNAAVMTHTSGARSAGSLNVSPSYVTVRASCSARTDFPHPLPPWSTNTLAATAASPSSMNECTASRNGACIVGRGSKPTSAAAMPGIALEDGDFSSDIRPSSRASSFTGRQTFSTLSRPFKTRSGSSSPSYAIDRSVAAFTFSDVSALPGFAFIIKRAASVTLSAPNMTMPSLVPSAPTRPVNAQPLATPTCACGPSLSTRRIAHTAAFILSSRVGQSNPHAAFKTTPLSSHRYWFTTPPRASTHSWHVLNALLCASKSTSSSTGTGTRANSDAIVRSSDIRIESLLSFTTTWRRT